MGMPNRALKNFHHLCIGIPLIPMEMARGTCGLQNIEKPVAELECKVVTCRLTPQQIPQRRQNRNHSGSLSGGGGNKEVNQCLQNQHSLELQ